MDNKNDNVMEFSYELYKESVEPLIRYKGLRSLHLIIGHPPFVRNSNGGFEPLSLEMEDDAGHTHNFRFQKITGHWFHNFLNLMFMEYFGLEKEDAEDTLKLYLTGERTQQIFRLDSGTLIYLRMDAGFTGSGMVLTAVPVFEPKLSLPSKIVSLGELLPGLVLFTGCYGSDRAYTMYSLLLAILRESPKKVSIVEQVPRYNIDFVKDSLVMRRIAFDPKTTYFSELLRALTTDVDIICLDDISDPKAFEAALKACASGKTVFGMLGASSIQEALDSILLQYEPSKREMIRYQLSVAIRAIIYQQKVPTTPQVEEAMVPAFESVSGDSLQKFIAGYEPGSSDAVGFIKSVPDDSLSFEQSLAEMLSNGIIDEKTVQIFSRTTAGNSSAKGA